MQVNRFNLDCSPPAQEVQHPKKKFLLWPWFLTRFLTSSCRAATSSHHFGL